MIAQGLSLTIIGMSIVFVFLALLVLVMVLLSSIVKRFSREEAQKRMSAVVNYLTKNENSSFFKTLTPENT